MECTPLLNTFFQVYHKDQSLGHCCFIYVDELACLPLSDGSQCVLYADDLLLFRPVKDNMDIQCLQNDIKSVEEWYNTII